MQFLNRTLLTINTNNDNKVPQLIDIGYIPVVGNLNGREALKNIELEAPCAKQLASILGMKSIEMFFPAAQPIPPGLILEARDKLSDHLPLFWSSMLKFSRELRPLVKGNNKPTEIINEAQELIDTIVRPTIIELNQKIEKERKLWFYKVFGHAYKGLKLIGGNPHVSHEQLIRNSLLLGADTVMGIANDFNKIDDMKSEVGLTYLLELGSLKNKP